MVFTVASEGTTAAGRSGAEVFEAALGGGGDVDGIEINEVRLGLNAMRVVASGAGGLLVHNVEAVPAGLAEAVDGPEALIAQDTVSAVAFVTERVNGGIFRLVVG